MGYFYYIKNRLAISPTYRKCSSCNKLHPIAKRPQVASKEFTDLLACMHDIHVAKNAGYAGVDNVDPWANFRESERFGVSSFKGCLVRMSDKFIRLVNLIKNPDADQVNESVEDTLLDLANYCLIAICLWREGK